MTRSDASAEIPKLRLAVLLLAAGEGSRLGSYPKLLLCKDGQTLLQRFSSAIEKFSPVEYLVVTGFHAQAIELEISKLNTSPSHPIKIIQNSAPERGQSSSVRLGLQSLQAGFDVLLVALSDQPEVGANEIQELLAAFAQRDSGEEMILPMVNSQRGNPVLFSAQAVLKVLAIPDMVCRIFMDAHPNQVRILHTSNQAFILDVDTPADIQKHQLSQG
jgi:molybdenum cofactor cytidylyltransferase